MLKITNLKVAVETDKKQKKAILKGMSLQVDKGELVAVMGPNGSGKSTLAYTLSGHPHYEVTGGKITMNGKNLLSMSPDERALAGLFLAFQYPVAVPGVTINQLLHKAYEVRKKRKIPPFEFMKVLREKAKLLAVDEKLLERAIHEGFSGGEKKRIEVLQMAVLEPKFAVMDETDSGLDIDALRAVAEGVNKIRKINKDLGVLMITHYRRILDYVNPDRVVVISGGKVATSGGKELIERLEKQGYKGF